MFSEVRPWFQSQTTKSRRIHPVGRGLYKVVHHATGRFIMDSSNNVNKDVDRLIGELRGSGRKYKLMRELLAMDPLLEIHELPSKGNLSKLKKDYLTTMKYPYLCIN